MKILQIVPYFYPAWAYGGPAKLVYDTSNYFASKGHQVIVYTSDAYDRKNRMPRSKHIEVKKNLHIYYFRNVNNTLAYIYNIFFTPGLFIPATTQVKSVDIIHMHDFYTPQNVWISFLARIYRKPYILSVHGCLEEERLQQRSLFKRIFLKLFGVRMLKGAAVLIATSVNEVEAYKAYVPKNKIVLLGHGVDENEFKTTLTKEECRNHFSFSQKKVIVTYLGRIHKIKGLDLLVKAISGIKNPNIHFVIAGSDDGYLLQLKKLIREKKVANEITLLGTCFGEEKSRLFKSTDIFVYPSYSEGFSLGLLEMTSVGRPLVITTGCHFDLVEKYKAGHIVNPNQKEIKDAIEFYAKHEEDRIQAGDNSKKLIDDNYSMQAIGDKILLSYQRALK